MGNREPACTQPESFTCCALVLASLGPLCVMILEISLEVCRVLGMDACLGNALISIYNGQCPLRLGGD